MSQLNEIAKQVVQKGLLAMDESISTCNKRFAALNIPQTENMRRIYRELLVTTPGLGDCISGAILSDETIHQQDDHGKSFVKILEDAGIIPGIKVDMGAQDLAGFPFEKITEGLDGLRDRLKEYKKLGARFAKWRAVILVGENIPTYECIAANTHVLVRYAALCQEAGIVPIVEPEVLMDGNHTIEKCAAVTEELQHVLFQQLYLHRVQLEGIILKPNMILPGKDCPVQVEDNAIAKATIDCFLRSVPAAVPGIAFLSGGQPSQKATSRLNAMHLKSNPPLTWRLTFSFSRAIEYPALTIWNGKEENKAAAQRSIFHRASCDLAASHGKYITEME